MFFQAVAGVRGHHFPTSAAHAYESPFQTSHLVIVFQTSSLKVQAAILGGMEIALGREWLMGFVCSRSNVGLLQLEASEKRHRSVARPRYWALTWERQK
jgi:hypothetical protein